MIEVRIEVPEGVVVVEVKGPLEEEDFSSLSRIVDDYLGKHKKLQGIIIRADRFPGWENFSAFVDHLRFVRDHHRRIEKVAVVTDSPIGKLAPVLSGHFVSAELRHFPASEFSAASAWVAEG